VELLGGRKFEVKATPGSGLDKFNVAFFTASCDTPETNKRYAEALKLDYPILSDPGKATARAYGVVDDNRPNPQRWTYYIGEDGKILHIDKSVKSGSHGADIVAKLRELGVAEKK
jgi:peroxiredoxin Q/BCP